AAISSALALSRSTMRQRSRTWRATGSDRGRRALSLRAQPDVSRAPDFHARLGVDVRLVVCADPVRRARALVSPPCARYETRLQKMFGAAYCDYQRRVKRWIPGLL